MQSSLCTLTEDQTIGGIRIKEGDNFQIDMYGLHMNPDEWQEPEKYIPDRFNPDSPYFLTPSGKKRHPMSFAPFLGGKRVCLGKTFAEAVTKISGPNIIFNFDFEFIDKEHMHSKPANNITNVHAPVVFVKVRSLTTKQ